MAAFALDLTAQIPLKKPILSVLYWHKTAPKTGIAHEEDGKIQKPNWKLATDTFSEINEYTVLKIKPVCVLDEEKLQFLKHTINSEATKSCRSNVKDSSENPNFSSKVICQSEDQK